MKCEWVTLKHWSQDTQESGRWVTYKLERETAEIMVRHRVFDRAYILEDEEKGCNGMTEQEQIRVV